MIPVSVVVPVKNEERTLSECLERLGRFAEIIVVDSASTDRTAEIARLHGATVIHFAWNGQYPKKRNWLLMSHKFATEWVLFLDADEYVDHAFCEAVRAAVASGKYQGYWLNYTNHFMGCALRHGVPQRKLAMFRVGAGLYERIEERAWSNLDMEVHEHPTIQGPVGEIKEPIDHRDFRGMDRFIDRHRDYAKWEANRYLLLLREGGAEVPLTRRQRFKYANIERWWYAWFYFLYTYVGRLGFLDGGPGFYYAFLKAWYFCIIRLLIVELRLSSVESDR